VTPRQSKIKAGSQTSKGNSFFWRLLSHF